jgi:hypothetical protein
MQRCRTHILHFHTAACTPPTHLPPVVLVLNPKPHTLAPQVGFKRDQYKKCANLLEAVGQLMEFFQAYEQVPKIKALTKRLVVVQQALQVGAAHLCLQGLHECALKLRW